MKILISGSSGLVGSKLLPYLLQHGNKVVRLVHGKSAQSPDTIFWDIDKGILDVNALEGFDAIIHLAGENIAVGRWTEAKKKRINDSRVNGTKLLSEAISQLKIPPKIMLSASATGYYGNREDTILTETSAKGSGFLSDVCAEWEKATIKAKDKGVRVVNLRFGVIFGPNGGALAKMILPFKMCLGGAIGSGQQYMSWISIDDVLKSINFLLTHSEVQGPINIVSPHPVSNENFTKSLGKVLNRPTFLRMPTFVVRLVFGEMADEMLLSSTRVHPKALLDAGYIFTDPDLEPALAKLLKNQPQS